MVYCLWRERVVRVYLFSPELVSEWLRALAMLLRQSSNLVRLVKQCSRAMQGDTMLINAEKFLLQLQAGAGGGVWHQCLRRLARFHNVAHAHVPMTGP